MDNAACCVSNAYPDGAAVCLTVKPVGEPDALIGHVRFDERGWETARWPLAPSYRAHPRLYLLRHADRRRGCPFPWEDRKSPAQGQTDAIDPSQTSSKGKPLFGQTDIWHTRAGRHPEIVRRVVLNKRSSRTTQDEIACFLLPSLVGADGSIGRL